MKYVSSVLMGGLGNYMFQIAAAYAYSRRYNKQLGFNLRNAIVPHGHPLKYTDTVFRNIDINFQIHDEYIQYNEEGFDYNEIPNYGEYNLLLNGYFQSEKYFKEYSDDVKNLFMSYDVELENETTDLLNNENICSIHVRRGDFLKYKNHHPVQTIDYFINAMESVPIDSVFFIFSDDIDWCKKNFTNFKKRVKFIEGKSDYEDLYIMSRCSNHIISNSTFSWWGAWLSTSNKKIVVAPNNWFGIGYSHYNTNDIYCDGWIRI